MPGRSGSAPPPSTLSELGDQGRAAVRGRRVDDEAGRLVDHREVVVEVDDRGAARLIGRLLAQEDQGEDRDADGDRDVGEVEGRPGADVDEVGDGAGAHAVGEVAERAAGEQADGDPHPRPVGLRANRKPTKAERERRRRRSAAAPPPPARPKATPLLWARVRPSGPSTSTCSPGTRLALDDRLRSPGRGRRRARRAPRRGARRGFCAALTRGSGRRSLPATTKRTISADHRAEVEREAAAADRRQEAAEEVEVGVGRLGDEVEHRAQRAAVDGHPRHPGDQDPERRSGSM